MFSLVIAGVLGYLLGSIPTAYLLVRWKSDIDIRSAGSGNVGTLNSYMVTKSKRVGGAVLLLDVLKGVGAVVIARAIGGGELAVQATGGVMSVLGHNFPVWLKFKGGRGLAPAAGVMLAIGWAIVAVWGLWWFLGFKLSRDVNVGNVIACVATLLLILLLPDGLLGRAVPGVSAMSEVRYFAVVLFGIILVRHVEPAIEFVRKKRISSNEVKQ